ncbi:MAG TPA: DUF4129 domain-containing protein [Accumulibacter sp.]|nr:DUF4129 domain-containing protein [Accumulibacter sp.]
MRLEAIAIHLRRRSAWEALDLGHTMLRRWARALYGAWFATYWIAGVLVMLLMWRWPDYAMLVLWWLKPLFDRVLLLVCSRSAFGEDTGVREVWRALPRLWRGPGTLSALTLRRFSLTRSFLLPVWQLEEQRGVEARTRLKVLSRRCRGHAVWLTFHCANMSTALLLSALIVLAVLAPGDSEVLALEQWLGADVSPWRHLVANLLYMLAETVIEPLYVASGFSLYLNRRSELEAWDVELGLRRLAERRAATASPLLAILALVLALPVLAPEPAHAGEPPQAAACPNGQTCDAPSSTAAADDDAEEVDREEAAEEAVEDTAEVADAARPPSNSPAATTIRAVLADRVFGQVKDDWRWRWRRQETAGHDENWSDWFSGLRQLFDIVAEVARGLSWIAGALALAAIVVVVLRHRHLFAVAAGPARRAPDFLFGLDLRPESLPTDIAAAARAALASDRLVEALSLLYRGALVVLMNERQIEFHAGDTENDCLRRVAARVPPEAQRCFGEVVDAWRLAAYGRLPVMAARVESLTADWETFFGQGAMGR